MSNVTASAGSMFDDPVADALVNPVNVVGLMGAGLAARFKRDFPESFVAYRDALAAGELALGRVHLFATGRLVGPRWIVHFPTKAHWRDRSRLEWISSGLDSLADVLAANPIRSVAVPALGCGLGGLAWTEVEALIRSKLSESPVEVRLFAPRPPEPGIRLA